MTSSDFIGPFVRYLNVNGLSICLPDLLDPLVRIFEKGDNACEVGDNTSQMQLKEKAGYQAKKTKASGIKVLCDGKLCFKHLIITHRNYFGCTSLEPFCSFRSVHLGHLWRYQWIVLSVVWASMTFSRGRSDKIPWQMFGFHWQYFWQ